MTRTEVDGSNGLEQVLFHAHRNEYIVLPYGLGPNFSGDHYTHPVTEADWNSSRWNPPQGSVHTEPDPDASPKPTWAELLVLHDRFNLDRYGFWEFSRSFSRSKDRVANTPASHSRSEEDLYVGGGIEHMPALMHHSDRATGAGKHWPLVVMRDVEGQSVALHTSAHAHELLDPLAASRNRTESAFNLMWERISELDAIIKDEHGGLDESATDDEKLKARTAAYNTLLDMRENADTHLAAAAAKFDAMASGLPDDFPVLKGMLAERLEAVATGHQKHLKGTATQHGIDNWASCGDQDEALEEIAKQAALALIEIERVREAYKAWKKVSGTWVAQTESLPDEYDHEGDDAPDDSLGSDDDWYRERVGHAAVKAAFDAGVTAIEGVEADNAPVWSAGSTSPVPDRHQMVASSITLTAGHPAGVSVDGNVALVAGSVTAKNAAREALPNVGVSISADSVTITLPNGHEGSVHVEAVARNLCGPSRLSVELLPPSSD